MDKQWKSQSCFFNVTIFSIMGFPHWSHLYHRSSVVGFFRTAFRQIFTDYKKRQFSFNELVYQCTLFTIKPKSISFFSPPFNTSNESFWKEGNDLWIIHEGFFKYYPIEYDTILSAWGYSSFVSRNRMCHFHRLISKFFKHFDWMKKIYFIENIGLKVNTNIFFSKFWLMKTGWN